MSAWQHKHSGVSCSWWLGYMSKCMLWTSDCVAKPTSSVSCSWLWLCYMLKGTLWTSACVAKATSSVPYSWSSLFREEISVCALVHMRCYRRMQLCEIHNSFASYDGTSFMLVVLVGLIFSEPKVITYHFWGGKESSILVFLLNKIIFSSFLLVV